jgi:hypothetical protein
MGTGGSAAGTSGMNAGEEHGRGKAKGHNKDKDHDRDDRK